MMEALSIWRSRSLPTILLWLPRLSSVVGSDEIGALRHEDLPPLGG